MSSISGITSAANTFRPATQNNFGRLAQDFTAIGGACKRAMSCPPAARW